MSMIARLPSRKFTGRSGARGWWLLITVQLLMLPFGSGAWALEVEGLTRFSTLVTSRAPEARAKLARRGLGEVIVRLSGSSSALSEPAVLDALDRADAYLAQARYESTELMLNDESGTPVPADRLIMTFNQDSLETLLRDAGLPIWGKDRPQVICWVIVDGSGDENWVAGESEEAGAWLLAQGRRRGLALQFPLFDLTDQMAISAGNVRQLQADNIATASRRYGASHFVAGVITPTASGYRGRWLVSLQGESFVLEEQAASLDAVTALAVGALADRMAARYAVRAAGGDAATRIQLTIEGVDSLDAYANLNEALRKLSPAKRTELAEVRGETLVFQLQVEGSAAQFMDLLALNRRLRSGFEAEQDSTRLWRLHYRYVP